MNAIQHPANCQTITVASNSQLGCPAYFRRLAIATAALELPRRVLPDVLADTIYGFEGTILWGSGSAFTLEVDGIDKAFGDDPTFRWVSNFVKFANAKPKQRPQKRIIERLRLIDLYFKIAHPEEAKEISHGELKHVVTGEFQSTGGRMSRNPFRQSETKYVFAMAA